MTASPLLFCCEIGWSKSTHLNGDSEIGVPVRRLHFRCATQSRRGDREVKHPQEQENGFAVMVYGCETCWLE